MKKTARKRVNSGKASNKTFLLVVGILLLGVGIYGGFRLSGGQEIVDEIRLKIVEKQPALENSGIAAKTLLYGIWADNNSIVKAYNLEDKKGYVLAVLPQDIKRVSFVTPGSLYFINSTDNNDHGREIAKYSIQGKNWDSVVRSDEGFGIDDYMISPNGNYMTTWEVQLSTGSNVLNGGRSRVYSVNLSNPERKNLLYNEVADKPIHYPRGVNNEGTVTTDMFLPNSGPGWAYGMGVSDFAGLNKRDVVEMANGTYGRQPKASFDGESFVFVGYDGTYGSGTEQLEGLRRAIIHPNTIEIFSLNTMKREKLTGLSNKNIYDDVRLDREGKNVFLNRIVLRKGSLNTTVDLYNLDTKTIKPLAQTVDKRGVGVLSKSKVLVASPVVANEAMGNLGETYQFVNRNFEVLDMDSGELEALPVRDTNMQLIGLIPNSEISTSVLSEADRDKAKDVLQMYSFGLKVNLLKDRVRLQSRSQGSAVLGENAHGVKALAMQISGLPEIPDLSGIPVEGNEDLIKQIEQLIELIKQLLGILEQEVQN